MKITIRDVEKIAKKYSKTTLYVATHGTTLTSWIKKTDLRNILKEAKNI